MGYAQTASHAQLTTAHSVGAMHELLPLVHRLTDRRDRSGVCARRSVRHAGRMPLHRTTFREVLGIARLVVRPPRSSLFFMDPGTQMQRRDAS